MISGTVRGEVKHVPTPPTRSPVPTRQYVDKGVSEVDIEHGVDDRVGQRRHIAQPDYDGEGRCPQWSHTGLAQYRDNVQREKWRPKDDKYCEDYTQHFQRLQSNTKHV